MIVCDHFRLAGEEQDLENRLRRLFAIVAKSRSEDEEFFRQTHVPIRLFQLIEGDRERLREVDETQVVGAIATRRDTNHTSVILGKAGIGKSELCAYVFLALKERVPTSDILYLDRSVKLPDILDELNRRYRSIKHADLPGNDLLKLRELRENPNVYSYRFVAEILDRLGIQAIFESDETATESFRKFTCDRIHVLLEHELDPDAPKERNFIQPGFLEARPYSAWAPKFMAALGNSEKTAKLMNEAYVQGLRAITGIVDLKTAMMELAGAIGRRLYVIFEDYALSDLESEELRNFMESVDSSYNCEFVVAGIEDNLQVLQTKTGLERHDFYQFEGQNKECLFLAPETAGEFLAKYLLYWKERINPRKCQVCDSLETESKTLFPFNEAFASNVYAGLHNKRARGLVDVAFQVLREYSGGVPPFKSRALYEHAYFPGKIEYDEENELEKLVAWYGKSNPSGSLTLESIYPALFDVPGTSARITGANGDLTFVSETKTAAADWLVENDEEPPISSEILEHAKRIPNWRANPEKPEFAPVRNLVESGANRLLMHLTDQWRVTQDWAQLDGPPIKYDYQTNYAVGLAHSGKDIVLDPGEYTVKELEFLLRLGQRQGPLPVALLENTPVELALRKDRWRKDKWTRLLGAEGLGSSWLRLKDAVVRGAYLIMLLNSPFSPSEFSEFADAFGQWRSPKPNKPAVPSLQEFMNLREVATSDHTDDLGLISRATQYQEAVFQLLQAVSTYDGTVLFDPEDAHDWLELDPVQTVASGPFRKMAKRIAHAYKIRVGERDRPLRDVLRELSEIARDVEEALPLKKEECARFLWEANRLRDWLTGVDRDRLRKQIDEVKGMESATTAQLGKLLEGFFQELLRTDSKLLHRLLKVCTEETDTFDWLQGIRMRIVSSVPLFQRSSDLLQSDSFNAAESEDGPERSRLAEKALQGLKKVIKNV